MRRSVMSNDEKSSKCNVIYQIYTKIKIYDSESCKLKIDQDVNGAKNIG